MQAGIGSLVKRHIPLTEVMREPLPKGFVYLTDLIPYALLEIRYYTSYNCVGAPIDGYLRPLAIITEPAAVQLEKAAREMYKKGLIIKVFDAYRPLAAVNHFVRWAADENDILTKEFFYPEICKSRIIPDGFIAERSSHSRGSTVDLTLTDMKTGRDLDMGTAFDFFGEASMHGSPLITQEQAGRRLILREAMENVGFTPYETEWWHYTLSGEPYPDTYFEFMVN